MATRINLWKTLGANIKEQDVEEFVGDFFDIHAGISVLPNGVYDTPGIAGCVFATMHTTVPLGCGPEYGTGTLAVQLSKPLESLHVLWMKRSFSMEANPFEGIEGCIDSSGNPWLIIHFNSKKPKQQAWQMWGEAMRFGRHMNARAKNEHFSYLPESSLSVLLEAKRSACLERERVLSTIQHNVLDKVNIDIIRDSMIHVCDSCVSREVHAGGECIVYRHNAISAAAGQSGIIMGPIYGPHYLVTGKGNPKSFRSAPSEVPIIGKKAAGGEWSQGCIKKAILNRYDVEFYAFNYNGRGTALPIWLKPTAFEKQLDDFVEINDKLTPVWHLG